MSTQEWFRNSDVIFGSTGNNDFVEYHFEAYMTEIFETQILLRYHYEEFE